MNIITRNSFLYYLLVEKKNYFVLSEKYNCNKKYVLKPAAKDSTQLLFMKEMYRLSL